MRLRTLSLILVSTLALTACKGGRDQAAAGGPPGGQMPPMPVTVVTLKPQDVTLSRELTGRAMPSLIAEVRPQVSGIVQRRLFIEGGRVRAGQPLYQLDTTAYVASRESAQAQVVKAQAALETARLKAVRSQQLANSQMISKQDNDNAQAALRQAQADLHAAQAGVRGANVPLGFARITAPISGQIGKSSVTQGALVTAAQPTALATIQQMDPMFIDVMQSSSELLQLRREIEAGDISASGEVPVKLTLEDGSTYDHDGRLRFAESTVDPTTGSVTIRVTVPNPQQLLLPGMAVRASLAGGTRHGAILVPQPAVARDPRGGTTALVVGADNKVEERKIVVSRTVGANWLVESGLKAGDRVIVEGLQKVKPGAAVQAAEQGAAPAMPATETAKPAAAAKQ